MSYKKKTTTAKECRIPPQTPHQLFIAEITQKQKEMGIIKEEKSCEIPIEKKEFKKEEIFEEKQLKPKEKPDKRSLPRSHIELLKEINKSLPSKDQISDSKVKRKRSEPDAVSLEADLKKSTPIQYSEQFHTSTTWQSPIHTPKGRPISIISSPLSLPSTPIADKGIVTDKQSPSFASRQLSKRQCMTQSFMEEPKYDEQFSLLGKIEQLESILRKLKEVSSKQQQTIEILKKQLSLSQ
ncbi:hypothetical protein EHI8A_026540 [Entamoeba histolytica HM-1:IMSS-B]|uniref:Uncharacterized protein n=6 Tax=Entamoeba histolytica TaxID=5759 RepID=C4M0G9_ENTH1|nr:hypothetical protein EHI_006960 [Entamoeba histolytica HM-1:IMSS]EMD44423.1 Hypothetical protein EHI5A_045070 [Entamoeba histolytica KU27]EMH74299.1 hypothetical protein EHI8A_026540 [Entamoeba histolytica HM-1:IMSS-B]EMS11303.1 hypothetical protein KM1_062930 [Entamoeba histolytica HM-3:IMSS]ENY62212.1 hypothetical protein EHI7A_165450 [Entamoeba histolytica HM-1:IMSS-A]GAT94656.1 hypothetical protein CL6EHI_006960 [Entamoeba histolytica]|eukprot:XP_654449.1 hypothetical protein EHI_006960 [Entamoeba histolytica HM-1:IMSS]